MPPKKATGKTTTKAEPAAAAPKAEPAAAPKTAAKVKVKKAKAVEAAPAVAAPAPVAAAPERKLELNYILPARVKTVMDDLTVNAAVDAEIAKVKGPLDEYNRAKEALESGQTKDHREVEKVVDGEKKMVKESFDRAITAAEKTEFTATIAKHKDHVASYENDYKALKQLSLRIGSHAADAVANVCDYTLREILGVVFAHTIEKGRKQVGKAHMYESDLSGLHTYPLFSRLPLYLAERKQHDDAARTAAQQALTEGAVKQFAREHKLTRVLHAADKAAAAAEPAAAAAEEPAAEPEDKKAQRFAHYIRTLSKDLVAVKFPDNKCCLLSETINHLDDLVVELIVRICRGLLITIADSGNKTITSSMVLSVVKRWMIDGHSPVEAVSLEHVQNAAADTNPRVAKHSVSFPSSHYDELETSVKAYLKSLE
jgi:hypothetical protein